MSAEGIMRHYTEDLQVRVLKLERQNRQLTRYAVMTLIVALSILSLGLGASKKTVEANEFVLKDKDGIVRARFMMKPGPGNTSAQIILGDDRNAQGIKAVFDQDGLYIADDKGFAASFGANELVVPASGESSKTSAASIILYRDKHVIWKAP
jgi:hypothetical protein